MKLPEVGEGVAFGVGATNFRTALIEQGGDIEDTWTTKTPRTSEDFFELTASEILDAAHHGAKWAVLGVPGPVRVKSSAGGYTDQNFRITNIPALNDEIGFDPITQLIEADSATEELLRSNKFTLLTVNDGDLAAQAAAHFYGSPNYNSELYDHIGDLINGSGTGGAIARRDERFFDGNLFHPDPGLWELGHEPQTLEFPSRTLEKTISGDAVAVHLGKPAEEIAADDPIFEEVARGMAKAVIDLGIYGGADLVVVSGGFAIGTEKYYVESLKRALDAFGNSHNPMADKVPDLKFPPAEIRNIADTYEMYGARGAILSFVTRQAIDKLVAKAE